MFKPELTQQPAEGAEQSRSTENSEPEMSPELRAGREALLADLEEAGEEGLRIIYYAADVVIKPVPGDPERVTFETQQGNSRWTGKRKFGNETVTLNSMVLHSKYKNTLDKAA